MGSSMSKDSEDEEKMTNEEQETGTTPLKGATSANENEKVDTTTTTSCTYKKEASISSSSSSTSTDHTNRSVEEEDTFMSIPSSEDGDYQNPMTEKEIENTTVVPVSANDQNDDDDGGGGDGGGDDFKEIENENEQIEDIIFPDESMDFLFSISVQDGIRSTTAASTHTDRNHQQTSSKNKDNSQNDHDSLDSSIDDSLPNPKFTFDDRRHCGQQHLQWCLHRGTKDSHLPIIFWRTPFVNANDFTKKKDSPEEQANSTTSNMTTSTTTSTTASTTTSTFSEEPVLIRYLSQTASDFVYNKHDKNKVNDSKRKKLLIYIICPSHLSNEVKHIEQLWYEAFPPLSDSWGTTTSSSNDKSGYDVIIQQLKSHHFDREKTIYFERNSKQEEILKNNDGDDDKSSSRTASLMNNVNLVAAVRGAGFLYGYPSIVFYSSPTLSSFVCTQSDGTINGYGAGTGICLNLVEQSIQSNNDASNAKSDHGHLLNKKHAALERTEHEISRVLGHAKLAGKSSFGVFSTVVDDFKIREHVNNTFFEFASNARKVASKWLENIGSSGVEPFVSQQPPSNLGEGEELDMIDFSKVANQCRLKHNSEYCLTTTGSDCPLISFLLCNTSKQMKQYDDDKVFKAPLVNLKPDTGTVSFPWKGSPTNWKNKSRYDTPYKYKYQVPVQQNKFLIHYGVVSFLLVAILDARPKDCQRETGQDDEQDDEQQDVEQDDEDMDQTPCNLETISEEDSIEVELEDQNGNESETEEDKSDSTSGDIEMPKTKHPFIGRKIAKVFNTNGGTDTFYGTVIKVEEDYKGEWFFVKYDDGDSEHMKESNLQHCLDLYDAEVAKSQVPDRNLRKKKRRRF